MVLHIKSEEEFKTKVLESEVPVIVDFWAEWCGPCRMLGPIFEDTAKDYEGKVEFVKINVDEAGEVAAKYSVMSIPTLLVIKGGEVVGQQMGAMPKDVLKKFVDESIE